MNVVLDTNVLIAAFATHGICHALFEVCLDQHRIVLSEFILQEVAEKLEKKIKVARPKIQETIRFLRENCHIVKHGKLQKAVSRDPKDDPILALASSAEADYIVSGDSDLLDLRQFRRTPIVNPRSFWVVLRESRSERYAGEA